MSLHLSDVTKNPVAGGAITTAGVQPPTAGPQSLQDLISQFTAAGQESKTANLGRETEIRGLNQQVIDLFSPGGGFGRGFQDQIERLKRNTVAGQTQSAVSSGLFNTTTTGNLGAQFEQNVGVPARLQLADLQAQRFAGALGGQAGFIERIEDTGPRPELLADLVSQAADQPGGADAVTNQAFTAESKRRGQFKRFTRQQGNLEKQVAKRQSLLEGVSSDKTKRRARIQKSIDKLNVRLSGTKSKLGGLGDAAFSDEVFESEKARRKQLAQEEQARAQTEAATNAPQGTLTAEDVKRLGLPRTSIGTTLARRFSNTLGTARVVGGGSSVFGR